MVDTGIADLVGFAFAAFVVVVIYVLNARR